jgi:hypothetical protein
LQQRRRRGRGTAATSHCAPDLSRRTAVAWTRWTIAPPPARTAQPPRRTLPATSAKTCTSGTLGPCAPTRLTTSVTSAHGLVGAR